MTTSALAIFVKTPGLSPVKTRLAADIGTDAAEAFYLHSVRCMEELALSVMRRARGMTTVYWAVGEKDGLEHPIWRNLPRLWTGEGNLGERLHHVYTILLHKHGQGILLGSDSPQLRPQCVIQAQTLLAGHQEYVIGPAEDGGYYLFGGRTPIPRDLWLDTPYSDQHTCAVFAEALSAHGHVYFLEREFDVDTRSDLEKLKTRTLISPAQTALMHWLAFD